MDLTVEEGGFLVKFAREEINAHFGGERPRIPDNMKNLMSKKSGVFVKLNRYPSHTLRGCFGYTEDIIPLCQALGEVSISAAFRDPRFHPMRKIELKATLVEVSILSKPELLKVDNPLDYPTKIKIGRDGIIVGKDSVKGVLLPQVLVEFKWNSKEALSHACMMAGLKPDAWHYPDIKIYRFNARIFAEKEPGGEIIEGNLKMAGEIYGIL